MMQKWLTLFFFPQQSWSLQLLVDIISFTSVYLKHCVLIATTGERFVILIVIWNSYLV